MGVLKFFEGSDLGWEREGEIRLGLFEIERDKAWVGREMRGIRPGCVWVGPEWVWVSWVQDWAGLGFG